jgi:metalloendopeptidase OMA1, mitochondrial
MVTYRLRLSRPALWLVFVLFVSACTTVPETGRSQLLLISSGEELQLGLSQFSEVKKNTPLSKDAELTRQVQQVGQRIAAVAQLPGAQWEFVLFDKPDTANAFCLPGGKVGIYSGILTITRDDAGLATVIAHEIAHAVARHGAERISQGLMVQLGGEVLASAMRTRPDSTQNLILGAYGLGSEVGVMLPHSREQELEADHIGLLFMARAGYNPRAALAFWQRFSAYNREHGGRPIAFLSTHPLDDRRIAQIEALLPQAEAEYRKTGARP